MATKLRIDEINALNPYDYTDKLLDSFRRDMVNRFSTYPHTWKGTKELYAFLLRRCHKMYLKILTHYNRACGGTKRYDEEWLLDFLLEFDPITGYQFSNEWERKMYRQFEETESGTDIRKRIKRAMTLLNQQVTQKAIEATDRAQKDAYEERKVVKVRWITMEDEKVCGECGPRHGVVFRMDKLPEKHYFCRCWLESVNDD